MSNTINAMEKISLCEFTENAYLNYSMYVITDRALPFIGDGLKPVQRRIIYTMFELGLKFNSKFKKSARTVGDVLGKYHPHSDNACYETMVLMAQPFSYRYPLIEGQGNWGTVDDPKSFAAMRYTESKLSKYSEILLDNLEKENVDWISNFDSTLQEPKMLPARLPNILLNGTTGIAVGMTTDIPTHNLKEVAKAVIMLIENPNTTLDTLLNIIKGPDFPTEAEIITSKREIHKIYQTGKGSIRMRAVWKKENNAIVITALPYQVSGTRILEQIALQMQNRKLPIIGNLRDESDYRNTTRLIIVPKFNHIDINKIMSHLFFTTDLEKSYRVNLNMIGLDGRPSVKNLIEILSEWLTFRRNVVRRQLNFRLVKILRRLHLLEGIQIAFLSIDKIIHIIRSECKPKSSLMSNFPISKEQAEFILQLKLFNFSSLEEVKICNELKKLEKEKDHIESILSSDYKIDLFLKKELHTDIIKYGDNRRSPLQEREEAKMINDCDMFQPEPITIILSEMGWIRSVKGHDIDVKNLHYKEGDKCKFISKGKSNQLVAFIDSTGRSYSINPTTLPSTRRYGELITNWLTLPPGATIDYMLMKNNEEKLLIASTIGYGFICTFDNIVSYNKTGKMLMFLTKNARIIPPLSIKGNHSMLLAITKVGRMLIFPINDLPILSKGKGKKIIDIISSDIEEGKNNLCYLYFLSLKSRFIIHSGKQKIRFLPAKWKKMIGKSGACGTLINNLDNHIDYIEIL